MKPIWLLSLVSTLTAGNPAAADPPPIRVGMSTVLTGPAAGLGQEMKRGVELYFEHLNRRGGVHGRPLSLVALDDGYEPRRTAPNMRKLISDMDVFAVLGNVGTPTAVVAAPIAQEAQVPFFAPLTGASILRRTPPDRWVWNFRASYAEEMQAAVDALLDQVGVSPERIAFFTQEDAYGDAGFSAAAKALARRGHDDVVRNPHGRYQRNTVNVEGGLERILSARERPLAVLMVGTYQACSKFIRLAERERLQAVFVNLSFVGAEALAAALQGRADGRVVITQVVPSPNSSLPAVRAFRAAMGQEEPTFNSLEGWLAAKAFAEALERAGPGATRETFVQALESTRDLDLGLGVLHQLSPDDHQVSHRIWPTVLRSGTWQEFDWKTLRRRLPRRELALGGRP